MLRAVGQGPGPIVLARNAVPFVIAPTGTMANNGAVTVGTALPKAYANCYLYLPANAIQSGSTAGWYFASMSSTTVGTVYQQTYTSGVPTIPGSPTAWTATGPGAYTGVTSAVTGPQITIPANTLGANGALRVSHLWSVPGNTNTKTCQVSVGGTVLLSIAFSSAAQFGSCAITQLWNQGAQNANVFLTTTAPSGVGASTAANTFSSVNFAAAQTFALPMQLGTATDYLVSEAFLLEVIP